MNGTAPTCAGGIKRTLTGPYAHYCYSMQVLGGHPVIAALSCLVFFSPSGRSRGYNTPYIIPKQCRAGRYRGRNNKDWAYIVYTSGSTLLLTATIHCVLCKLIRSADPPPPKKKDDLRSDPACPVGRSHYHVLSNIEWSRGGRQDMALACHASLAMASTSPCGGFCSAAEIRVHSHHPT